MSLLRPHPQLSPTISQILAASPGNPVFSNPLLLTVLYVAVCPSAVPWTQGPVRLSNAESIGIPPQTWLGGRYPCATWDGGSRGRPVVWSGEALPHCYSLIIFSTLSLGDAREVTASWKQEVCVEVC